MKKLLADLWVNIQSYYNDFVALLPKVAVAIVFFTIFYFIAVQFRKWVGKGLSTRMDDPLLARFLANLVKITLVTIAFLIVLRILGLTYIATGIITGASVSAIVVGFAFKDIGENFLAGIMLAFKRPFRVGDTVELNGQRGKVVALNLRDIQIKSVDGKDIYIPNANVIKNPVINFTLDGFLRFEFELGLSYGCDVKRAIAIIKETLATFDEILKGDRSPNVTVSHLGTSTMNLMVYYWLDTFTVTESPEEIKMAVVEKTVAALTDAGYKLSGEEEIEKKEGNEKIPQGQPVEDDFPEHETLP
jgi:small-conductance mechanosensitive channel